MNKYRFEFCPNETVFLIHTSFNFEINHAINAVNDVRCKLVLDDIRNALTFNNTGASSRITVCPYSIMFTAGSVFDAREVAEKVWDLMLPILQEHYTPTEWERLPDIIRPTYKMTAFENAHKEIESGIFKLDQINSVTPVEEQEISDDNRSS